MNAVALAVACDNAVGQRVIDLPKGNGRHFGLSTAIALLPVIRTGWLVTATSRHDLQLRGDVLADERHRPWSAACREAEERERAGVERANKNGRAKTRPASEPLESLA